MTTFNDPFQDLPTPSDYERLGRPKRYAFDGATKLLNINEERRAFHRWAGKFVNLGLAYRKEAWEAYYKIFQRDQREANFIQSEDARDEHDTQDDVAAPPW